VGLIPELSPPYSIESHDKDQEENFQQFRGNGRFTVALEDGTQSLGLFSPAA
jgi:hypothetical protein